MPKPAKALLGSTKVVLAPTPPPIEQPQTGPSAAAPIAATSTPPRREHRRHADHHHDGDRGDDGDSGGDADDGPPKRRDHHGDRTTPPPAQFSLAELPDDALLTQREIAAVLRVAVSTVETWRRRGHSLKWARVGSGLIRYRAGDLRHFLASGAPRKRLATPPAKAPSAPPPASPRRLKPRRPSRRRADRTADAAGLEV